MRHRNMRRLTGQPGWMRFGFSPGCGGRGRSRFGPCGRFMQAGQFASGEEPTGMPAVDVRSRLKFLKSQMGAMEQNLAAIKAEIENLEGADN